MQKEWKEKMIKVSSQSMPNLTNIFRIGREVVKSNISSDNKNIHVASVCATTKIVAANTLSDKLTNYDIRNNQTSPPQQLIHQNKTHNNTQQLQTEESALFVARKLSQAFQHGKLPLYPLQLTRINDHILHDDLNFARRKNDDGSHRCDVDNPKCKFRAEEIGIIMESCQKRDQEVIRFKGHHHACRFDCDQPNDILVDDMDMDANDIHQQRSNLRALMIVSTLIGIVSSFFTYLLPFIVCDADKTVSPLLATLFMSAALTCVPTMTAFLSIHPREQFKTLGKGIWHKKGQVHYSFKSLLIAMSTCILILLSFVLIHLLVRSDFQTMFPIYITMGPFLAIIEIVSLVALMKIICDTDKVLVSANAKEKSSGNRAVKHFLCYPKGLANILVTLIVIISIFLSNYATTSTFSTLRYVHQKTDISEERFLSSPQVQHESRKNQNTHYNASPLKPVLLDELNKRLSNNAVHQKRSSIGINKLYRHGATIEEEHGTSISNLVSKNYLNNENDSSSFQLISQNYEETSEIITNQKYNLLKTATTINSTPRSMHERTHASMPNIVKADNELKVVHKTSTTSHTENNRHLNLETQLNLSTTSKNISWHHVLPIWRKVMHNLATKMETNENKKEETQKKAVINTWKNTLLGILAIILFASLFLQLSFLITIFTTDTKKPLHWINIIFIAITYWIKKNNQNDHHPGRKGIEEKRKDVSFCELSKNTKLQYETTRSCQSLYCDDNNVEDICSKKNTNFQYHQDCLEKKPFGDKNEKYDGFKKLTSQIDSLSCVAEADAKAKIVSHSYFFPIRSCFNGFKTFIFRIKTIFRFYLQDDYLQLLMPMSFYVGLQDGFMARDFLHGYAIHHLQITNVCLVVASMGVSRMMFSWVSEKMVGSGLDGLLLVLAIGFQCGLSAILYGWVPSSKDQAMFYATSFIWGATSASLEFLILCHLNMILNSKGNWAVLVGSTIFTFHRHLGLATMFGMDTFWVHQFSGRERGFISFATFVISVIPLGMLIRSRPTTTFSSNIK